MSRRWVAGLTMVVTSTLFLGLTLLVAAGSTQQVDDAARELFRPHDMWSTPQHRAGDVIDGLKPLYVVAVAAALVGWISVRRASVRPIALLGAAVLVTGAATWVTKQALDRPDTHGFQSGGSYSSGHVAVLLVVLGCLTLLAPRIRWWMWAGAGVVVGVMAVSLMVQATHWLSDVIGGGLLGAAVLAGAALVSDRWRHDQRESTDPVSCRYGADRH